MASRFAASRNDGRSDQEVVCALVQDSPPETIWTHQQIMNALSAQTERVITKPVCYQAVAHANRLLLKRHQRYLSIVRNQGYRVVRAEDHLPLARRREDKAARQMRAGVEILRNCRMEELTETQRAIHQGQMLIMSSLYENMKSLAKRIQTHDDLIAELLSRTAPKP